MSCKISHIDDLAGIPRYLQGSDFTVMFIQPILSGFEHEPSLQEYAFNKHVLIVTPVTLLALLRTVGLYWQQQSMADNAKKFTTKSDRVAKFTGDFAKVGRGISTAINAYNDAVGSYESRILPSKTIVEDKRKLETIQQQNPNVRKLKQLPNKEEE